MVLYAIIGQQEMIVRRIEATGLVLLGLAGLACAFLPAATLQQRSVVLSRPAATSRASGAWRLWAAEEGEGEKAEESAPAPTPAPSNPVDDVFNSVPFLTKRKEALEKEKASILENLDQLDEQYKALEDEWGSQVASIRKDYDTLRARYVNDTAESANVGRSQVFVELLASVDDFERARMAYKSVTDSEKEVLSAYEAVKDRIVQAMLSAGMEEVPTVGHPFDFKMHDCMFTESSMEYAEEIVSREFAKGFMIGGKCVRPAKVATSLGPGPN